MADVPPADPEVPRTTRALAVAALLLLITSLWLPWWGVRLEIVGAPDSHVEGVAPFREHALTWHLMTIATGVLVLVAAALLFVRTAARSHHYEPRTYRRHVALAMLFAAAALASTAFWPDEYPHFWGGMEYGNETGDGSPRFRETAMPLLGWWTAFVAVLCLAAGILVDRRRRAAGGRGDGREEGRGDGRAEGPVASAGPHTPVDKAASEPTTEK